MPKFVDISLFGDKELQRKLKQLDTKVQKKIVRQELRKSAKRLKPEVVRRIPVDTGRYREMVQKAKISSQTVKRGEIRLGIEVPRGMTKDEAIKMMALEYGTKRMAARSHWRAAVNDNTERELKRIGEGIAKGIIREAGKGG